jgi:protein-S-isoprenylcysteine O-methyltransferase Ste14
VNSLLLVLCWISTAFLLIAVLVINVLYRHKGRPYAAGKEKVIQSPSLFKAVDPYLRFSTLVFGIVGVWSNHPLTLPLATPSVGLQAAGLMVSMIGLGLFVAAKLELGHSYSPCFDSLVPKDLVSSGVYRWIRHPIYTGNLVLILGIVLMSQSAWVIMNWVMLLSFYWRAAQTEESTLSKELPGYAEYLGRSGRFIPRFF